MKGLKSRSQLFVESCLSVRATGTPVPVPYLRIPGWFLLAVEPCVFFHYISEFGFRFWSFSKKKPLQGDCAEHFPR